MQSLKRLHSLAPSVLYPGHGPAITDGSQKIQQYLEHREGREKQASVAVFDHCSSLTALSPSLPPGALRARESQLSAHSFLTGGADVP